MKKDPVIDEVRKAGEKLAQTAGYDIHDFFDLLRQGERRHATRVVHQLHGYQVGHGQDVSASCAEDETDYVNKGGHKGKR